MNSNSMTFFPVDATAHNDRSRCGECGHSRSYHAGGKNCNGACSMADPDGKKCPCKHGVDPKGA